MRSYPFELNKYLCLYDCYKRYKRFAPNNKTWCKCCLYMTITLNNYYLKLRISTRYLPPLEHLNSEGLAGVLHLGDVGKYMLMPAMLWGKVVDGVVSWRLVWEAEAGSLDMELESPKINSTCEHIVYYILK